MIELKPKLACTFGSLSDKESAALKFGTFGVGAIILVTPSMSIEVPTAVKPLATTPPIAVEKNPAVTPPKTAPHPTPPSNAPTTTPLAPTAMGIIFISPSP